MDDDNDDEQDDDSTSVATPASSSSPAAATGSSSSAAACRLSVAKAQSLVLHLASSENDDDLAARVMAKMTREGVEFRRGSAGGGNQVRQPYLRGVVPPNFHAQFPNTDHVHFYGFYIGNFPDMKLFEVDVLCSVLNSV